MNHFFADIGIFHYVCVSSVLFVFGICGIILNQKNIITLLMSIELMLLAVNINFTAFSVHLSEVHGQIFALIVLTVAAAEAAIGLALLVVFARNKGSVAVQDINELKG